MTNGKLGKKLGRVEDPRTLQVNSIVSLAALTIPKSWGIGHGHPTIPMFANDRYGDCTFASSGHRIITQERAARQGTETQLTDDDIIKGYAAVTGFDPATGANDNGAYMLDVANYLRKTGLGKQRDGSPHTVAAFAEVARREEWARAAAVVFGGLWLGVWLPISAQSQEVWDVPADGPTGDGQPGSWGGHAIYASGYDAGGLWFYTWGELRKMTWHFFKVYCDEAFVFISQDYLYRARQTTPRGFSVSALEDYLKELS
jgi:hypothetical protein